MNDVGRKWRDHDKERGHEEKDLCDELENLVQQLENYEDIIFEMEHTNNNQKEQIEQLTKQLQSKKRKLPEFLATDLQME